MSSKAPFGSLKGTHRLLRHPRAEPFLLQRLEGEIDIPAPARGEMPLQPDLIQRRTPLRLVERDHQVDVGFLGILAAGDGPEYAEPHDAQSLLLSRVRPQR